MCTNRFVPLSYINTIRLSVSGLELVNNSNAVDLEYFAAIAFL
jgi:hypothetical protein